MRELKFRVYSFLDKQFHYFTLEEGYPQGIAGGTSEPQQYIGFKDAEGNDIYEGDIVNFPYHDYRTNGKIIWENLSWIIHEPGYVHKPLADFFESDIEIIGNIFELPCKIDHNAECLVCDCWPSDCPYKTKVN